MSSCDLCGKEAELFRANIEDSLVNVCDMCGRFGKILGKKSIFEPRKINMISETEEEIFVGDFNKIVKRERERKELTQEELAKIINEKTSVIQKLENKEIEPSFKLIKKLEKYFGITLTEKQQLIKEKTKHFEIKSFTMGDLVNEKQKRAG